MCVGVNVRFLFKRYIVTRGGFVFQVILFFCLLCLYAVYQKLDLIYCQKVILSTRFPPPLNRSLQTPPKELLRMAAVNEKKKRKKIDTSIRLVMQISGKIGCSSAAISLHLRYEIGVYFFYFVAKVSHFAFNDVQCTLVRCQKSVVRWDFWSTDAQKLL